MPEKTKYGIIKITNETDFHPQWKGGMDMKVLLTRRTTDGVLITNNDEGYVIKDLKFETYKTAEGEQAYMSYTISKDTAVYRSMPVLDIQETESGGIKMIAMYGNTYHIDFEEDDFKNADLVISLRKLASLFQEFRNSEVAKRIM